MNRPILAALALPIALLLASCAAPSSPMQSAISNMNRGEVDRLIASSGSTPQALSDALASAMESTKSPEPQRSFAVKLYRDLIKAGADPLPAWDRILNAAVSNPVAIDLLAETGADINRPSSIDRATLLTYTLVRHDVDGLTKLLRLKPNLNYLDGYGYTPLGWTVQQWVLPTVDYGVKSANEAKRIAFGEKATRLLVAAGANVNQRFGKNEETVLMLAAQFRGLDAMRYLLSVGANPQLRNSHGNSLDYYVKFGEDLHQMRAERREQELAKSREIKKLLGQVAGAAATVAIVSNTSMTPENKAQIIGGVTSDLVTGGNAATTSVANALSAATANRAMVAGTTGSQISVVPPATTRPAAASAPAGSPVKYTEIWDVVYYLNSSDESGERKACTVVKERIRSDEGMDTRGGLSYRPLRVGQCSCTWKYSSSLKKAKDWECRAEYLREVTVVRGVVPPEIIEYGKTKREFDSAMHRDQAAWLEASRSAR